jgi:hypothetical protein
VGCTEAEGPAYEVVGVLAIGGMEFFGVFQVALWYANLGTRGRVYLCGVGTRGKKLSSSTYCIDG